MKVMMKVEPDTKTELQKVAGEIQAQQGGSVSLSEAIDFLIAFYHKHKAA
jgi:ubiquinone biosynthesis protein UbiJ